MFFDKLKHKIFYVEIYKEIKNRLGTDLKKRKQYFGIKMIQEVYAKFVVVGMFQFFNWKYLIRNLYIIKSDYNCVCISGCK